ncbi:hypothetical protein Pint_20422 [Pistacia integerrima]|uniref:Uncharacterized protein n=1 Tax=Pistacia integerrima TaxID=434235 RepID=A0ACC0XBW3_9ROSI|nr:hypothetical protein Pint_20422 [Pistacia integerrima]
MANTKLIMNGQMENLPQFLALMVEERGIIPGTVLAFLESRLQTMLHCRISASAHLPCHSISSPSFEVNSSKGTKRFNLIDGGIAAKNPTLLAICEAAKEMSGNRNSPSLSMVDSSKLLVLSLGTGASKRDVELEVGDGRKWGLFNWFMGPNNTAPFFDVLFTAMDDMVEVYTSAFFHGLNNYLRIQYWNVLKIVLNETADSEKNSNQTDCLKYTEVSTDNSKKKNLEHLEEIGKDLLKKPVSEVNLETVLREPIENGGTHEEALIKFARRLSEERMFRQQHSQANLYDKVPVVHCLASRRLQWLMAKAGKG